MRHVSARNKLMQKPLSGFLIHKEMLRLFPKKMILAMDHLKNLYLSLSASK